MTTKKPPTIISAGVGYAHRVSSVRKPVLAAERTRAVHEAIEAGRRAGEPLDSREMQKRVHDAAVDPNPVDRLLETGAKIHRRQNKGGRSRNANDGRNRKMAAEFLQRYGHTGLSATALKADIGKAHGLGRRASITAIDRGLKILCSLAAKVHD